jgi:hypothetical protein
MNSFFVDKRRHPREKRTAVLEFLKLGDGVRVIALGICLNKSHSGSLVNSDFVIYPGQVIIFREKERPEELKFCTVAWSRKLDGLYTAGLKFI